MDAEMKKELAKKIEVQPLEITTIYDRKSGQYGGLIITKNNAVAIRSFADDCSNEKSMLAKHPEDYDLVNIGKYYDETGEILSTKPITLANAAQFAKEQK